MVTGKSQDLQSKFKTSFLFNFSRSYYGGGLKRLLAYSKYFNENGGANFIVNSKAKPYIKEYLNNEYYYLNSNIYNIINGDKNYLLNLVKSLNTIDLYYSYGIPIAFRIGKINWFHLSNVLPLVERAQYNISMYRSIELTFLGFLIKKKYSNADILSAESNYSLTLFPINSKQKQVNSPNGSDKEIELFGKPSRNNIAVVVGTSTYKDLTKSYNIFLKLQKDDSQLKMVIFGEASTIPFDIRSDKNVEIKNITSNKEVLDLLSSAKFYINTSKIENSWNSASEGILLAAESFISDISPHLELLKILVGAKYKSNNGVLHIKNEDVFSTKLPVWSNIIQDMIKIANNGIVLNTIEEKGGIEFHSGLAYSWSAGYKKRGFNKRLFVFSELFKKLIKPDSRWLDAGCGSGVLSRELTYHGCKVDAIDGSRKMIEYAKSSSQKNMNNISYKEVDLSGFLSYSSSSYEGVLSSSVIEYIDNPNIMLSEFYRITKENGFLIISAPNLFSLIRIAQDLIRFFSKFIGKDRFAYLSVSKNSYSSKQFIDIVEESGFTVKSIKRFSPILNRLLSAISAHSLTIIIAIKK